MDSLGPLCEVKCQRCGQQARAGEAAGETLGDVKRVQVASAVDVDPRRPLGERAAVIGPWLGSW
eukprot:12914663-Prorocentrum_lima.AAC.1